MVPLCRQALLAAFLLVFVFTLGSNIIAQVLGRPQHWTLAVVISDQATMSANVPFAAAIAMFLTLISLTVVGIVSFAGSRSWVRQRGRGGRRRRRARAVAARRRGGGVMRALKVAVVGVRGRCS